MGGSFSGEAESREKPSENATMTKHGLESRSYPGVRKDFVEKLLNLRRRRRCKEFETR